jgi:ABC-type transport system involved in multi-copper enzyme maturation permease subunit
VNARRLGTIIGLELTQRVRSVAWYVLLGIFALVLLVVTALSFATFALATEGGPMLFSFLILLVLLLALLVSPTLSGSTVNGDRDAATLAPVQVTLVTTAEILIGKFLAAWIAGLAFLVVSLPFLVTATLAGGLQPATILTSLAVLVIEVGVVAGIGVGFSAIVARPLFSVACTYLVVAALTVGTLIAFVLGGLSTRTEITTTQRYAESSTATGDVRCSDWETYTTEQPRFDHVWWILAANPFVVLADATPTTYTTYGTPEDLFGQIATGVRLAQVPPEVERRYDHCDTASMTDGTGTIEDQVRGTSPSWFVGLLVQLVLTGGLLLWGWARTRTPARTLPPGTRIA